MRRAIKSATNAEKSYQDAARELGCVVCRFRRCAQPNETNLHHRNVGDYHGQKQLGQDCVVSLCAWHHDGRLIEGYSTDAMREAFGPSFKHAADFREWTMDVLPGYGRGTEAWQQYQDEILFNQQTGAI